MSFVDAHGLNTMNTSSCQAQSLDALVYQSLTRATLEVLRSLSPEAELRLNELITQEVVRLRQIAECNHDVVSDAAADLLDLSLSVDGKTKRRA